MAIKCLQCQTDNPDTQKFCKECGKQLPPAEEITVTETIEAPKEELTIGATFGGRYEIVEELGRGGMGKVYKALDTQINEEIAIKVMRSEIASDEKTLDRFGNELRLARKIAHKNVCKMFHLERHEETPYITMEYVKGEDLKTIITKKEKLSGEEAISIAKQVCDGLAEAHELGVIHRDLKPSNIMIDEKSHVKIMDFGIARSLEAPGVTQTGVIIGTPDYISPEQVEGEEADRRSDIYSLGIILYEMITGSVPFKGDTALSVALKHKSQLPQDPRKLNPEISRDLRRLVLICMEKDKERRYQKAEDLLDDLKNIEEGFPLGSKIQPRRMTFMAALVRKKLLIPVLAFIALILAVAIITQFFPKEETFQINPNKPSVAILYFKNNTGDDGLDHWRSALAQWLITDISQSKYIDVLPDNRLFSILRKMNLLEVKNYATEDLQKIADEGRVNRVIQASYSKAGDIFRIDYSLLEADSLEQIGSNSVRGEGEESFPEMVDELTRKIKTNLEFSEKELASDIDLDVEKITTSYPEAYRFYSEGKKYHSRGEYEQSRYFYNKAIEIDPEFAMAYRAIAATNTDIEKNLKKALELSDRISDKERYLIEGDYYKQVEGNPEKAIEAYSKLLKLYPDDLAGNHNIAILYTWLDEVDKAIKHLELAYQKDKTNINTILNLAHHYADKELFDKAIEGANFYLNNVSDHPNAHVVLLQVYRKAGKYKLALEEAEKISALNPKRRFQGPIYYLMGDFSAAEEEYKKRMEDRDPLGYRSWLQNLYLTQGHFKKAEEQLNLGLKQAEESERTRNNVLWIARFHNELAYIYLLKGNPEEALKNAEIARERAEEYEHVDYQTRASTIMAYACSKLKLFDEALNVADGLKNTLERDILSIWPNYIRFHIHVIGLIELEKGNIAQSIKYLKEALALHPWGPQSKEAYFIEALALAYYKAGDLKSALKEYEKIPLLTYRGRFDYGYIYAKSFYMLGKINEELKNKQAAIENYEKFLDLWKDADPGITEVEDSRKRLAGLNQQ